jgi:arylsulfatase A-like enzyme
METVDEEFLEAAVDFIGRQHQAGTPFFVWFNTTHMHFRTHWEGAFRVPAMVRWPGRIAPGTVSSEIVSHLDWLPTFLAAAGEADIKDKLLGGHQAGDKTFRVHLERADITSNTYWDYLLDHAFLAVPTQAIVGEFLATFQEFTPRQKAASFTVDQVMEKLRAGMPS